MPITETELRLIAWRAASIKNTVRRARFLRQVLCMFDRAVKFCHRSHVRRVIALLALLAFAAATAAPAIAACRMRAAQQECCCKPAPTNALCAPDCCDAVKAARPIGDVSTRFRGFVLLAQPLFVSAALIHPSAHPVASPVARLLVGLHQRAAPRLPLRI